VGERDAFIAGAQSAVPNGTVSDLLRGAVATLFLWLSLKIGSRSLSAAES